MDEQQLERIEELLQMFNIRTSAYEAMTNDIIQLISDPVVRVICDAFNVEEDDIEWDEVNVSSPIIGLKFIIHYSSVDDIPDSVNIIAPSRSEDTLLRRTVAMGFPIIYAASTYEEFNEFFTNTINAAIAKQKITTDQPVLTADQQLQAYMHRPTRKVHH